ncbi:hypothetical protein [Aquibaculum arenosum]|uniref:CcmD family protein n=1 Tax=Aquibaculum arenosum TaxID=3032591 RepID=A0ABT5YRB0_9PROT|nr:hypothetical protein [Fodinicurvata sp. CAU 1616]MDF2097316.1 hypothetical protein [Fodinicurvata sp. CAU 1616]
MRPLLLLCALALLGVAMIPLAGDLAGVRLMSPPGAGGTGAEGPRVLLNNNFVVSAFWAAGWVTLALLCVAAAAALDQQSRLLRLYRQLDRKLDSAEATPRRPAEAPPRRPAPEPRFEPRLASESRPEDPDLAPAPPRSARGPVLRADR